MAGKAKSLIAERLKETAQRAGITAEALGDALGVTAAAIYAWWSGRNEPGVQMMSEYARITGTSLSYLAHGEKPSDEEAERLIEMVMRFADRLASGEQPGKALDQAVNREGVLTEREARSLDRRAEAMRAHLSDLAGRSWWELTAEERRDVARRLIQQATDADQ